MLSRFLVLPEFLIYDNGCNLYDFALNRSPAPFIRTKILSDGFHWKNHKNCSPAFNSSEYPSLAGKASYLILGISSVLHEQKNRYLDKLKSTSVHMKINTFARILIHTLETLNLREIDIVDNDENDFKQIKIDSEDDANDNGNSSDESINDQF